MINYPQSIIEKIRERDFQHAGKLTRNLNFEDLDYLKHSNSFFKKYSNYLYKINKNLDYSVECYLKMISDMHEQRNNFIKSGKYSNSSFKDVEMEIYSNPEIINYHMHGLTLAQFLWFDQYERILFFSKNLLKYFNDGFKYLEVGGGHGLYIWQAIKILHKNVKFDLVDISQSSLNLARGINHNHNINFILKDIYDFKANDIYDFITVGEVLEHLEDPGRALIKIKKHLSKDGTCYVTTPINAPMIDHIFLFNDENEIRKLFKNSGFKILEEKIVITEKYSYTKAMKFKIPIMYAAFVKPI